MKIKLSLLLSLLVVLSATIAHAITITYTTLPDYPGAQPGKTIYYGIDGDTKIGVYNPPGSRQYGFTLTNGTFTQLDIPLGSYPIDAEPYAALSNGVIVGTYNGGDGAHHSFSYNGTAYTTIDNPLASNTPNRGTQITGVSLGKYTGYYQDNSGLAYGFVYDGTTFTPIDVPSSLSTFPKGIDGNNVVGEYVDSNGNHGFVFNGSTFQTIDPSFEPIAKGTLNAAIDVSGQYIVGEYGQPFGQDAHGYLYDGSTFTSIDFPGAVRTFVTGIDGNQIVGYYNIPGELHGFIATIPEPNTLILITIGATFGFLFRPKRSQT